MRSIPFFCLLLAACTAAPPPGEPVQPLKRSASIAPSPSPSASASNDLSLGLSAVRRMARVSAWVKRQGSGYEMSFLFYDTQDAGIFFENEPIVIDYAFSASGRSTAIASGRLTMTHDSQTFPVTFASAPGTALDCDLTATLPDGRMLSDRSRVSID
ncbi:MAG TPA: hypothetical protein V6D47_06335 [Oscillatoriaceae cyanobacterium]